MRRALALPLSLISPVLAAQNVASVSGAAPSYLDRYREIQSIGPVPGKVADANHLVLVRDVGQLTLEHGKLYLLAPVGGRTIGAVFRGQGTFAFAPSVPAEQAELERFGGSTALNDTLSEAILLFADPLLSRCVTSRPSAATFPRTSGIISGILSSPCGANRRACMTTAYWDRC